MTTETGTLCKLCGAIHSDTEKRLVCRSCGATVCTEFAHQGKQFNRNGLVHVAVSRFRTLRYCGDLLVKAEGSANSTEPSSGLAPGEPRAAP